MHGVKGDSGGFEKKLWRFRHFSLPNVHDKSMLTCTLYALEAFTKDKHYILKAMTHKCGAHYMTYQVC